MFSGALQACGYHPLGDSMEPPTETYHIALQRGGKMLPTFLFCSWEYILDR